MTHHLQKLLFFVLLICSLQSFSQSSVRGVLSDTTNFKPLAYSSVSLVRLKDSILIQHHWADQQNKFQFNQVPADTYFIRITRPGFADYEEEVLLKENENRDLGNIPMIAKANLLREVIIREKLDAIRIKGDTTEFLADSFNVKKDASVEDLLKKLPGIQVDKNGKITAQGETVNKVLVDGEEFFGDDPTVATRNIKAESVESVQVFDKKSETAIQTGVDDGEKNKTINLKLKEDAKKGYFGKVNAGAGTKVEGKNRYEGEAMFNSFKNKRKLAVFGATSNTNKTNLNWEDQNTYSGGDDNVTYDEESGAMYSYYYSEDGDVDFDGKGIPRTWYLGGHYSDKYRENKNSLNLNITHREMNVDGNNNTFTQYILPDTTYFDRQNNYFRNFKNATKGSGTFEAKPDSLSIIKVKMNVRQGQSTGFSDFTSENLNENEQRVNSNIRTQTSNSQNTKIETTISFNRKFKTLGRSFNATVNQNYTANEGDGFLRSVSNFYQANNSLFSTDTIDQQKLNSSSSSTWGTKIAYTEPLSKIWFLVTDYNLNNTNSAAKRSTFGKSAESYSSFVDSLSSDFKYDVWAHSGGLTFRRVTKKLNFSFGARMAHTIMKQSDLLNDSSFNRPFTNYFPSAGLNYKINSTASFGFNYNGRTNQPTIQQLQPLRDNSNPLNVSIGNTALKQSFEHQFSLRYNAFKPITGRGVFANMNFNFTDNDFSSNNYVDEKGRRVYQTINVDGNKSMSTYIYYYFSVKKWNLHMNANLNANINQNKNRVNFQDNINNNTQTGFGFSPNYSYDEILELGINFNWNYNRSKSSLRPDIITNFWIQSYSPYLVLEFPFGLKFNTDVEFNKRQQAYESETNLNTVIWNANISYKMLKSKKLIASVNAYDILNQNLGFYRTANSNFVTQNVYSTLKRYVLFSLTYQINNGPVRD